MGGVKNGGRGNKNLGEVVKMEYEGKLVYLGAWLGWGLTVTWRGVEGWGLELNFMKHGGGHRINVGSSLNAGVRRVEGKCGW